MLALIRLDEREQRWRAYMASVAYSIGSALYGENYPIDGYYDFLRGKKTADERTGTQIVSDIIARLKGGT